LKTERAESRKGGLKNSKIGWKKGTKGSGKHARYKLRSLGGGRSPKTWKGKKETTR